MSQKCIFFKNTLQKTHKVEAKLDTTVKRNLVTAGLYYKWVNCNNKYKQAHSHIKCGLYEVINSTVG